MKQRAAIGQRPPEYFKQNHHNECALPAASLCAVAVAAPGGLVPVLIVHVPGLAQAVRHERGKSQDYV